KRSANAIALTLRLIFLKKLDSFLRFWHSFNKLKIQRILLMPLYRQLDLQWRSTTILADFNLKSHTITYAAKSLVPRRVKRHARASAVTLRVLSK
ncbi:MAG: hypothetical protein ACXU7H_06650, partial [Burkholderiaceae bacterium]